MTYKSFTLVTRHSSICQPYSSIVYIQTLELIHDSSKRWHSTWQWSEESENYLAYRKVLWLTHITSYTHNFYDLSVSFLLLTKQSQRVTIIFIKSVHTHTHFKVTLTNVSWNFIFGSFYKICRHIPNLVKTAQNNRDFTQRTKYVCDHQDSV